jgi:pimeloyl-ACP methyl ester carboxylesterase
MKNDRPTLPGDHTMRRPRARPAPVSLAVVAGLLAGLAVSAGGAEVVVLKDGTILQGNVSKEMVAVNDPATGRAVPVPKADGLEMIDEGPKAVIFSAHNRRPGEVGKEVTLRPAYKAYTVPFPGFKSRHPLPAGAITKSTDFDANWRRAFRVEGAGGMFDNVEQQITYLDPYFCFIVSPTHAWRAGYRTSEMDPEKVRGLLATHPELAEVAGKPDPLKRIAVAKFMLDAGWLALAKSDLEKIRRDFPGELPKETAEKLDALSKEIDKATAALVIREAELALGAGRYAYASAILAAFPAKIAEPNQLQEATNLLAQLKDAREKYETGRRLLRALLDQVSGLDRAQPLLAAAGGPAVAVWPRRPLDDVTAGLVAAGDSVHAELHPDSAPRIETFVNLAAQAERERAQGRDPTKRPDELIATAVSGWVKGKNGATERPDLALQLWVGREMVLAYQRSDDLNTRNDILARYRKTGALPFDELAEVVSLLPPADPEDLLFRSGTPVPERPGVPPGLYRRTTPPTREHPRGIDYIVRLPSEYHHGRAYPLLVAVTDRRVTPEQTIGSLVHEADRHGYVVVAPDWANEYRDGWQWRGKDHEYVTAVVRDAVRRFCIDNDRVFLFGAGEGGNVAMDVGVSHPDQFAGVLAMSPIPKWAGLFSEYWRNAQRLPFYTVTGELTGESFANLKQIYQKWMPYGYPSLLTVYKGRSFEWFGAELAPMFDWMALRKRANYKQATLPLGVGTRQPWMTMRETDSRFYWLGADVISPRNINDDIMKRVVYPAEIQGDIRGDNTIFLRTRGIAKVSVWLDRELIDWSKPVRVSLNGATPPGYRAKVLDPDLNLMLDDYRDRGDRRNLILGRLEFNANP